MMVLRSSGTPGLQGFSKDLGKGDLKLEVLEAQGLSPYSRRHKTPSDTILSSRNLGIQGKAGLCFQSCFFPLGAFRGERKGEHGLSQAHLLPPLESRAPDLSAPLERFYCLTGQGPQSHLGDITSSLFSAKAQAVLCGRLPKTRAPVCEGDCINRIPALEIHNGIHLCEESENSGRKETISFV